MTDQIQQDFLVAYIAETVRLEMNGPAHQVARSNELGNREFGKLIAMHLQVQRDFIDGKLMEPDVEKIQWPWPGKTGTEIIKATDVPQQNQRKNELKIIIHRGTREIGGSVVELSTANTRIVIDVGLPLVDEDREPFDRSRLNGKTLKQLVDEGIVPGIKGLFTPGEPVDAVLLSHCHLDHVGMLRFTHQNVPVHMSTGTSKMMNAAAIFGGQFKLDRDRQQTIPSGKEFQIGDFLITPYSVDHSCYGSQAFLIEADNKRILYSGDLRFHGRKPGMLKSLIADVGPMNIDALIMEGTHFGNTSRAKRTEYELETDIVQHIESAHGLVVAAFSPIDVDRLISYFKAAMRTDRTFVVDAYAAFIMYLVKSEIPIPDPLEAEGIRIYFNTAFKRKGIEKLNQLFEPRRIEMDEIRSNPSDFLMAFRPNMVKLDFDGQLPKQTRCLYSYWKGYLENPEWQEFQQHIHEIDGDFVTAHTSGHIFVDDLVNFVQSIGPKQVIPIHTFEPNEFSKHFENVVVLEDGEEFEV